VQRPARGRRQAGKCRKPSARNRKGKRCKRWVKVTSFKHAAAIGPNAQPLVGARKLKPRRYRLRAKPRNTAGAGRAVGARFRVKRAR
jgi:hypothetical protein